MADDPRLRRLDALIGEWQTTITMLDDDGQTLQARDTYRWSANGKFVLHDVDAQMPEGRVQSMEIIALDPDSAHYVSRSYDPDGSFSDFTAELEGKAWRITGAMQRFSGAFSDDGMTLSGEWEQNDGAGNWRDLMLVELKK